MDIFKLFGEIAVKNDQANKAIDDTTGKAETSETKMSAAFRKIGESLVKAFQKDEPKKLNDSLADLTKTVSGQEDDLAKLKTKYQDLYLQHGKNSKEAKDCAKEIERLSKELKDNKSKLSSAEKAADKFDKSLKDVGDESGSAKDKLSQLGNTTKNALGTVAKVGAAAAAAVAAVGAAVYAAVESTMEYRTAMGKLDTAFTTAGHSSETATETYNGLVRVLGDTDVAVEAANHLALLCDNEKDLETWTNICTGVYATFGDSLPIEGLTEAANETAKVGQVTGPLADALNWAGISEEAFNESLAACSTEQERQLLIMETLNGVYDDASQKYQETNADIIAANEAQEKFTAAMASFGEMAQPLVTAVKDGFADLLTAVSELIAGADFAAIESAIDSAFSWLLDTAVPAVKDFVDFVIENKDPIVAAIAAVAAGFAAWNVVSIVQGVIGVIKAWMVATEGMTIAQRLLNLAMAANPIGIIITVITALVAAFIVLWNNCEGFRNFFINMWENIKVAFAAVVEWLGQAIDSIVQWFVNAWDWIKEAWSAVGEFFQGVWDGICAVFDVVVSYFQWQFETAKNIVVAVWSAVTGFFSGIWNGIRAVFAAVSSWFSEKFSAAKTAVENAWAAIVDFFQGIWDGICGVFSDALDIGEKIVNDIKQGISNAWEGLKSWFNNLWNGLFGNRNVNVNVNGSSSGGGTEQYAVGSILKGPTAFGINQKTGKTMIGGEAGYEAIAPIDVLQGYVANAVAAQNAGMVEVLGQKLDALLDALVDGNVEMLKALLAGHTIVLNKREVARTVREYA